MTTYTITNTISGIVKPDVALAELLTHFSPAALANISETSADVVGDLSAIRRGDTTPEALLAGCLDGADADRVEGWRDYVATIVRLSPMVAS